jgi:TPR repeat protein
MESNTSMFLNGNGVAKDVKQAFKFFSIATGSTSLPRQQAVLALSCSVTQSWQ